MAQNFHFTTFDVAQRSDAIGALIQNKPIICGGKFYSDFYKDCFVLGHPNLKFQMLEERRWPASIVFNQYSLWIVGGVDSNTSEFISLDLPPEKGPEFPFTIFSHSMIQFSDNAVFIIGGLQNGSISKSTWIVDPTNGFQIKEGPELKYQRCRHSCGIMSINDVSYVVVVGGTGHEKTGTSVELLDPRCNEWIEGKYSNPNLENQSIINYPFTSGPTLPFRLERFAIVPSPNRKGIVVIGGYSVYSHRKIMASKESSMLLELCGNTIQSLKWIILEQKLQFARCSHVAFIIPEEVADLIPSEEGTYCEIGY